MLMGASSPADPRRGASPGPCWGTSVLQNPLLHTPGKNPAGSRVVSIENFWILIRSVRVMDNARTGSGLMNSREREVACFANLSPVILHYIRIIIYLKWPKC